MSVLISVAVFYTVIQHSLSLSARGCSGSTCISPVWLERCKLSLSLLQIFQPSWLMRGYRHGIAGPQLLEGVYRHGNGNPARAGDIPHAAALPSTSQYLPGAARASPRCGASQYFPVLPRCSPGGAHRSRPPGRTPPISHCPALPTTALRVHAPPGRWTGHARRAGTAAGPAPGEAGVRRDGGDRVPVRGGGGGPGGAAGCGWGGWGGGWGASRDGSGGAGGCPGCACCLCWTWASPSSPGLCHARGGPALIVLKSPFR